MSESAGRVVALIALSCLLTACDPIEIPPPAYVRAQSEYKCTASEFQQVAVESKFCNENTDTFSSACFGNAIIRKCTKRALTETPSEETR